MIHAKERGFRLAAYLNKFDMSATFTDGTFVKLDDYGYSDLNRPGNPGGSLV